jgi:hypothetical protein
MELPPESELTEPIAARPGLCDAIHRIVRVVAGVVLRPCRDGRTVHSAARGGLRARVHATQDGAVDMEGCAVLLVELVDQIGRHVAGQSQFRIAGRSQEVELAALLADQNVAAGEIRAAGKIEADEGYLARAARDAAAGRTNAR